MNDYQMKEVFFTLFFTLFFIFATTCFAQQSMMTMKLPIVKNKVDVATFEGKIVKVQGVYQRLNVAKKYGNTNFVGRAKVVLADNSFIVIERNDKGLRNPTEIQTLEGKKVEIIGKIVQKATLGGGSNMASILASVIVEIEEIGLWTDEHFSYHYADGSANLYKISQNTIQYIPITKEKSSSGTYSGGEPKTLTIHDIEREQLILLLEKALLSKDEQHDKREMLTGVVAKFRGENEIQTVILKQKSPLKNEIEAYLKKLMK
jgi:hypothetical protein